MELNKILNERYTVKKFDSERKISDELMEQVKTLLRLSPSSTNIQPWTFTIASTKEGKEKVAKSTENYGFNTQKLLDASHIIVFSTKYKIDEEHLSNVLEQEDKDERFPQESYKTDMDNGRKYFLNKNIEEKNDKNWLESQVYLNVGHFVLGAKALGIDSTIMEGFDKAILNKELGFNEEECTTTLVVAIGYGDEEDFNMNLAKSRLSEELTIKEI